MPAPLREAPTNPPVDVLASAVAGAFRAASKVRGQRVLHPRGHAVSGRLTVSGGGGTGAELLDRPGWYDTQVRLSRAVGLPAPLPDAFGLAIRVLDCYVTGQPQDLLMTSTLTAPVLRRFPVPGFRPGFYGSLLPYDVHGRHLLLGARRRGQQVELLHATAHGQWQQWGALELGEPIPDGRTIRFDPWVTGGGLQPAGLLMRLRREVYPAAHVAPDE